MEQTRLYIEGAEVELTSDVQFLLNKQFEETGDPTTIINDWSKTVEIPSTQSNDSLFGHIYNPDRVIADGGVTGIYFDPYRKLAFRLEYGSSVIMTGYAKMTDISRKGGHVTYNVTLNGELGKVFQELKKITFDRSTEDTDYLIHGEDWVLAQISKELVQQAFGRGGQTSEYLSSGDVLNTIGFAPNNSFMDGFDYKTYQNSSTASNDFSKALPSDFQTATGVSPDAAIGDGLTPRGFGEYRSYQQLPFIYFNKLWRIFQAKAEAVTGWTFDLDNTWFATTNPYWYNVVMMLQNLDSKDNITTCQNTYYGWTDVFNLEATPSIVQKYEPLQIEVIKETVPVYNANTGTFNITVGYVPKFINGNTLRLACVYDGSGHGFLFDPTVKLQILLTNDTHTYALGSVFIVREDNTSLDDTGARIVKIPKIAPYSANSLPGFPTLAGNDRYKYWDIVLPETGSFVGDWQVAANSIIPEVRIIAADATYGIAYYQHDNSPMQTYAQFNKIDNTRTQLIMQNSVNKLLSPFSLNDLWNNDYTPFDFILRYCKMMRLSILADANNKTLRFTPTEKWMAEASGVTLDWTDKVDYSKDGSVKPISFDTQYINLGYAKGETAIGKEYAEKYGVNYGDMKLRTLYQFNNDTTELFEGLVPPITATLQTLAWKTLLQNRVAYTVVPEEFVDVMDADGKFVDPFGMMLLHCGLQAFQGGDLESSPLITDDTYLQRSTGKTFYSFDQNYVHVAQYPRLSARLNSQYLTFGIPKESFVYGDNPPAQCTSLYGGRWHKYMTERYNRNNKVVTLYVRLKPHEYASFSHNIFVTIGNQLYFVNAISDYDMTSDAPVKVELITIQDRNGYY